MKCPAMYVQMLLLSYSARNDVTLLVNSITYIVLNAMLNKIIDVN